jgi:bifunctional ADP-heptose synthase (sugar kinase/adenylyltransferase)
MTTDPLFPTPDEIRSVMARMRGARIGVLGDFCVDAYFGFDSSVYEISIETGKRVQHVREQRYSPGAAGNVVTNLRALGVAHIEPFGVIGDDMFGREMVRELQQLGASTAGMLIQNGAWDTPVYGKPLLDGVEQQRMDFGVFNALAEDTWERLKACIVQARDQLDFLIVNQQLPHGWCSEPRATWVVQELKQHWPGRHLVDARHFVGSFAGAGLKLNQHEAARLLCLPGLEDSEGTRSFSDEEGLALARSLAQSSDTVQFVTRGERGMMVCEPGSAVREVPGVMIVGPTDTVGAGDAATAMLAACRASKVDALQSAVLANLAASITVKKLNQTGTASEPELLEAARKLIYVHHQTLADEPRRAQYALPQVDVRLDIEIVDQPPAQSHPFRFALFDHDGTVSTLRQGWENVMEPVMMRAILGAQYSTAGTNLFNRVQERVRQLIEQSTGIQTIAQMDALVELVAEFSLVPPEQRLDAWGYKQVYNDALMEMVNDRLRRLQRGDLEPADFIMKGSVDFLRALIAQGVKLFLVSGTDEADTIREATALGYAGLFDGGIHGAKPGSRSDTKAEVIHTVLDELTRATGQVPGFLVCGDGPVEIRLGRRYGGWSLGVASSEERRFGLNLTKRRRLIRAGAHTVVPDFSQWQAVAQFLSQP